MSETNVLTELVQKAVAGDRAAFEELYQGTCRSVYFTCLNILKDEQEAQDVTQDVYLTAFEQLGALEDAGKFKPWLYRMAANKSINCLKKKKPTLLDDEQLQDMETEENENFLPEEYALNADKRALVLDIARKVCTEAQYQTILLYYFNELSIAEIAEIMECQENNVKKRMSIARAKIKEGVLRYEEKSGDKLYSIAVVPFLTALFTAQMQGMAMPSLPLSLSGANSKPMHAASSAKVGGRMMIKGLQLKIVAGIAAAVIVGGVAAAAVVINNQKAQEASAGTQEGAADTADAGNTGETEDLQETENNATEPESDEDALQAEADAAESEAEENEIIEEAETEEIETVEEVPQLTEVPEQEYTYTDLNATMYATQTVNIRTLPSTDGEKVGSLSTNEEITVTGQCNETSWYRFEYNGQTAYVSNNYVSDTKIEVAAAEPADNSEAAPEQSTSSDASSGLPTGVLDLTTLPREQWVDRGDWLVYVHGVWDEYAIAGQDIGPLMRSFGERRPGEKVSGGMCKFLKDLGISVAWVQFPDSISSEACTTMTYYTKYGVRPN